MGSRAPGISGTRRSCSHLVGSAHAGRRMPLVDPVHRSHLVDPAPPYKHVCARANTPDDVMLVRPFVLNMQGKHNFH